MISARVIRRTATWLVALGIAAVAAAPAPASAAPYVPGEVLVGYAPTITHASADAIEARVGVKAATIPAPREHIVRLPHNASVGQAVAALRRQPGVAYAVPNYIAHADGVWIPDDLGRTRVRGGWQATQWNFLQGTGVNAPAAWANLFGAGRPGGSGVIVAVLDTGVAYTNWRQYRKSPDFTGTRFVAPYDFVARNRFPLDRESHGTFVTGTIAEATNNGFGLTGIAYGATIMPVRVLDSDGTGDAATIARGIRYATDHGARVINLSLEFSLDITANDIPDILSAIRYAHHRNVVVVAASGNEGVAQIAYPARTSLSISVGATTRDRCLADYSNGGTGLDLVAPGGGNDSSTVQDPNCHPERTLPSIYQMTIVGHNPARFGYPEGIYGTSMAAPHVAAVAALVIASGVLGPRPTADQVRARLKATAQHLGATWPNADYGYGLVDAGAATAPAGAAARRR